MDREQPREAPDVEAVADQPRRSLSYEDLSREELIGAGGNAEVYRATVAGQDRPVALKVPRIQGTLSASAVDQFREEAETWAKLDDHPHVVGLLDWGEEPLPWLAMEYMDGGHLGERVGDVSTREAVWICSRVARALRHAHQRGVAHLDLKPANVLFRAPPGDTWDVPAVSDWGLAKLLLEHSQSVDGLSVGYAAPEQFDADAFGHPDNATDVFQLGVVAYELLAGRPPFEGHHAALMRAVMEDDPAPPSEVADVPPAVDDVVMGALAKQKADRYEDVLLFRDALDDLLADLDGGDAPADRRRVAATDEPVDEGSAGEEPSGTTKADHPRGADAEADDLDAEVDAHSEAEMDVDPEADAEAQPDAEADAHPDAEEDAVLDADGAAGPGAVASAAVDLSEPGEPETAGREDGSDAAAGAAHAPADADDDLPAEDTTPSRSEPTAGEVNAAEHGVGPLARVASNRALSAAVVAVVYLVASGDGVLGLNLPLLPSTGLLAVAGLLLGPAGVLGAAAGSLLRDVVWYGGFAAATPFFIVGDGLLALVPYALWGRLGPLSSGDPPDFRGERVRQAVEYAAVLLPAGVASAVVITAGFTTQYQAEFVPFLFDILQRMLLAGAVVGPPVLYLLHARVSAARERTDG